MLIRADLNFQASLTDRQCKALELGITTLVSNIAEFWASLNSLGKKNGHAHSSAEKVGGGAQGIEAELKLFTSCLTQTSVGKGHRQT